jgi:hemerythrin
MEQYITSFFIFSVILTVFVLGVLYNMKLTRSNKNFVPDANKAFKPTAMQLSLSKSIKQIPWRNDYRIDNGPLDNEHFALFGLINRFNINVLRFTSAAQIMPFMASLKEYTEEHFELEEELQRKSGYAFYDDHKMKHALLINELNILTKKAKNAKKDNVTDIALEIGLWLQDWLETHFLEDDLSMKPYINRMQDPSRK